MKKEFDKRITILFKKKEKEDEKLRESRNGRNGMNRIFWLEIEK